MLTELHKAMRESARGDFVGEAMLEAVMTRSVKDVFLDDPEAAMLGAETDPEIKDLVDSIPEYNDVDDETVKEINLESYIATLPDSTL